VTRLEPTAASLAAAMEALVLPDPDVADILAHLVADCARQTSVDACALMAVDNNGELSLLAAESHRAVEMEMLQIQREAGPCVDVLAEGAVIHVAGADAIRSRWPGVGDAIVDAGFHAVEGYPMRWRGQFLGGLNLFRNDAGQPRVGALAQAYADVATLVVVQTATVDSDQVHSRLHEALSARELVEQAKGVIAYREDIDLGAAYASLLRRAQATGTPLTQTSLDVVAEAVGTTPPTE
jgi:ANTAR domain-containing protein/GAF domain-containing protein